jgi:crotonobetainyl-CoA:carnitine CoA-transferase CaiB-like acyl-CoA transferase
MNPLNGIRILDLTNEVGQYCGKLLAQLGAEVIKVEPPQGDPSRLRGPFLNGESDPERGLHWLCHNSNKKSITLDLDKARGREIFKTLVRKTDVVLETFPPGYMSELGLGYQELASLNQSLVLTSITPFGQAGPWSKFKSSDLVAQALGGLLYVCGWPDKPPVRMAGDQAYNLASVHAAVGTVVALCHRCVIGRGQHVDVSVYACIPTALMSAIPTYVATGQVSKRVGDDRNQPAHGIFRCADGFVDVRLRSRRWEAFVRWLDEENAAEDLMDDKYKSVRYRLRPDILQHIDRVFQRFIAQKSRLELYGQGVKRGLEVAPVNGVKDVVNDEQLKASQFLMTVNHERIGVELRHLTSTFRTPGTPRERPVPAPAIGEHNVPVYKELLNLSSADLSALRESKVI